MQIPQDIEFWMCYEANRRCDEEEAERPARFFSSLLGFLVISSCFPHHLSKRPLIASDSSEQGHSRPLEVCACVWLWWEAHKLMLPSPQRVRRAELFARNRVWLARLRLCVCLLVFFSSSFWPLLRPRARKYNRNRRDRDCLIVLWYFQIQFSGRREECLKTFLITGQAKPAVCFITRSFSRKGWKNYRFDAVSSGKAFWWL